MDKTIGFIGTGQMATALATGFIGTKTLDPSKLFGCDAVPAAAKVFASKTGATVLGSIEELAARSEIAFVAVKPQQIAEVLEELSALRECGANPLWISIVAGTPIWKYWRQLGDSMRLVRVMPNTPCLVGAGASAFAASEGATNEDIELTKTLFATVGQVVEVEEYQLDAVTGLSGSGPAYVYMMIESLSDGGVKMGLPRDLALKLATQTVFGSARMVLETGEHPAVLRDRVSSPQGTTIHGTHALERRGFRAAVIGAVEAATRRAREIDEGN